MSLSSTVGTIHLAPEGFMKQAGGVRRSSFELLGALRTAGAYVDVAAWVDEHPLAMGQPAPSIARRMLLQATAAASIARKRVKRESSVTHSLYYDPIGVLASRPLVVTVYDMINERYGAGGRAARIAKRLAISHADLVIAISAATAVDVRQFFPQVQKVRVIHLGVSGTFLSSAPTAELAPRAHLLYVGGRRHYKNFAVLLDAFERQPSLRRLPIVLVGGGNLSEWELHRMNKLGVAFDHRPRASESELLFLYDSAVCLVVTSRCEGFGLPVLEAMSRSCPVVCSGVGSLSEIAQGHAHEFDPASPNECADAIELAIGSSPNARAGAAFHARTFTWEAAAHAHLRAYADVT